MSRINFKRALVITMQLKLYRNLNVKIIHNVIALLIYKYHSISKATRKWPKIEFHKDMCQFQVAIHLINH